MHKLMILAALAIATPSQAQFYSTFSERIAAQQALQQQQAALAAQQSMAASMRQMANDNWLAQQRALQAGNAAQRQSEQQGLYGMMQQNVMQVQSHCSYYPYPC
jgi:hypothetical protein